MEEAHARHQWIPITLTGNEVTVGVSGKTREWCIDIDNRGNEADNHTVRVRAYDGEELLDEKKVNPDSLVRVCLEATELRLDTYNPDHRLKYAFA